MYLIDFQKVGNVARLFLGNDKNYTGDDWNDRPYDANAGRVYDRYILGTVEMMIPFEYSLLEPKEPEYLPSCSWCMDDMKERKCPALVVYKNKDLSWNREDNFNKAVMDDNSVKIYLGDDLADIKSALYKLDENIQFVNMQLKNRKEKDANIYGH